MLPNKLTISVTDLRLDTRTILENAHFRGFHYIIERAGQPMVAILSVEEYQRLLGAPPNGDRADTPMNTVN